MSANKGGTTGVSRPYLRIGTFFISQKVVFREIKDAPAGSCCTDMKICTKTFCRRRSVLRGGIFGEKRNCRKAVWYQNRWKGRKPEKTYAQEEHRKSRKRETEKRRNKKGKG